MITTIKVEKSTAKEVRIAKIKYMGTKSLIKLSNDKYIKFLVKQHMVLLGKNTK